MRTTALSVITFVIAGAGSPARGQTAYFSAGGTFNADTGSAVDLLFANDAVADVRLRTWAHDGGTNAAGNPVAPGGIDSFLRLFDPANNLIAENDNISATVLDSEIVQSGLPVPAAGASYRANLTNVAGGAGNRAWAADVVDLSGSMALRGITTSAAGAASLAFGAGGGAQARLELSSAANLNLPGQLEVRSGGRLLVGNGDHHVGSAILRPGASMAFTGTGSFSAPAGFLVDGGTLVVSWPPPPPFDFPEFNAPLTVANGGVATFTISVNARPLTVHSGGRVWRTGGYGSRTSVFGPGSEIVGFEMNVAGGTTSLTVGTASFDDHAVGSFTGRLHVGGRGDNTPPTFSTGPHGRLTISGGAAVTVAGNVIVGPGDFVGPNGGDGTIILNGPDSRLTQVGNGSFTFGEGYGGTGTIIINDGTVATGTGVVDFYSGGLFINGGRFVLNGPIEQGQWNISDTQFFRFGIGGSPGAWTGRLDLTDESFRVSFSGTDGPGARDRFVDQLRSGYNGGAWDGLGIMSSAAAADPRMAIGYQRNGMRIVYTRYGDATLEGIVSLEDFNVLAANFGMTDRDWSQADFNFDLIVNLADFNILAANFGMSAAGPEVTPDEWAALAAAVPEPSAALAVWFTLAMWGMTARVRRGVPRESCRRVRPAPGR